MTPPGATADDLAIGIDIGGTKVAGGLVDKDGQVRGRARAHTPERSQSPQVVEDTIVGVIDELRAMATTPVSTVGIGAAGFVAADRATTCRCSSITMPTRRSGPRASSGRRAARTTS